MNAPLSPSSRHRGAVAYPFYYCMVKQALLLAGAVLVFSGGAFIGLYSTTLWPTPESWLYREDPLDGAVLGKLTTELRLTPEQSARIEPIIQRACADLQLISEEHHAQRLALLDEMSTTITPILTPEQQVRIEALEGEWQTRPPVKRDMRIVALF